VNQSDLDGQPKAVNLTMSAFSIKHMLLDESSWEFVSFTRLC